VRVLADTHILMWTASETRRLSAAAREVITDPDNMPCFSVISLWELAIKTAKRLPGFDGDPAVMRRNLLDRDWVELPVYAEHALAAGALPPIHGDPFDRMLVAQAAVEGALLLTADKTVARYPGLVRLV
jgi:PIN domain nuclease of toxin-antitoxin system